MVCIEILLYLVLLLNMNKYIILLLNKFFYTYGRFDALNQTLCVLVKRGVA